MSDIKECTWQGDPEALQKARSLFWHNVTNECVSMASSYYSFIKVFVCKGWKGKLTALKYAILSRVLLAIATFNRPLSTFTSNQHSILAGIYGKLSLTRHGLQKALECTRWGVDGDVVDCTMPSPHTVALLWADRAVLHYKLYPDDLDAALRQADVVVDTFMGVVLGEKDQVQAKRQLSRAFQKIAPLYLLGDKREYERGKFLEREARRYAEETETASQLLKMERAS